MKHLKWILPVLFLFSLHAKAEDEDLRKYGDALRLALPAAALGTYLLDHDIDGLKICAMEIGETQLIVEGLKSQIDATRPNGGDHSFPSGHTAAVFSASRCIQKKYGLYSPQSITSYSLAAFAGVSRVTSHRHYVRDVLAGAAIPFLTPYLNRTIPIIVRGNKRNRVGTMTFSLGEFSPDPILEFDDQFNIPDLQDFRERDESYLGLRVKIRF